MGLDSQGALKERGIDKLVDEAREDNRENDATLMGKKKCEWPCPVPNLLRWFLDSNILFSLKSQEQCSLLSAEMYQLVYIPYLYRLNLEARRMHMTWLFDGSGIRPLTTWIYHKLIPFLISTFPSHR